MARVTVEDCVLQIPNRFDLVMVAAQRARNVAAGAPLAVDRDNDKNPVVALREIAERAVSLDELREGLIRGHQRIPETDEPDEEVLEVMEGELGWAGAEQRLDDQSDTGDPDAEEVTEDDDVLSRMEAEPGLSFEGEDGNLVDRDTNDVGKAYDDGPEGISDALDDPENRFYE